VTAKVYANNQTNLTYAYDLLSRLTNRWSQAKGNTKYAYNLRGSLTNLDYASSTDLRFQFDALGRTTNMIDAAGTTRYAYANGMLVSEDGPWASDTVSYGYNNARLRSQLAILQPTGNAWTNSYGYDSARRLTGVTSPAGTYGYQFTGPGTLVARLDQPGGFWVTNTFDGRGRLTDTTLYDNTSTILNRHGYTVNDAHQRTTITRTNYAASSYNGKVDYTYDNAGEVRKARAYNSAGTPVAAENFDFGYDAGWNMLKRTNNAAVTSYTINNLNQITADGGASWGHDNNGNLTFRPRSGGYDLSYTYDDENQLLSVSSANLWRIEFTYDGRGRMRLRRDYTWSGTSWVFNTEVRYLYDGMLIVQERSSGNHPQVTYTRGTDLSGTLEGAGGIGGLLSRGAHAISSPYQLSSAAHYHADGNGNVTMLVGTGAPTIKAYYKYDPFGRTLGSSGSLVGVNAMRFSSKPVMGSSELYYYGYRFYDPSSQRWLNRDPLGEVGGICIYGFLRNSPLANFDSLGLTDRAGYAPGSVESDYSGAMPVIDMDYWIYHLLPPGPNSRTPVGVDWDAVRLPNGAWHKIGVGELDIGKDGKPKDVQFLHSPWPAEMQGLLNNKWGECLIGAEVKARTS
jgi:RHS repeat-associated protein